MKITALSLDLSLTNAGMSLMKLPVVEGKTDISKVEIVETILVQTEKEKRKGIYQNSDDLRRLSEISCVVQEWEKRADVIFAEIPSGAQNARAATAFGAVLGILSTLRKPLIQVQKTDRGMVVAGRKTVAKSEVIEWAVKNWPNAGWITRKLHGEMRVTDANEHVADSIAIAIAGTEKDQWKNFAKMLLVANKTASPVV